MPRRGIFTGLPVALLSMIACFLYGCAKGHNYQHGQLGSGAAKALLSPGSDIVGFWEFGQVKEGDILEHEFIFKNTSERKLRILDVNTSCGCTASQIRKNSLSAHESTSLDVKFNSKGYSGEVKQYIYVVTDDPQEPLWKFMIKAKVLKE